MSRSMPNIKLGTHGPKPIDYYIRMRDVTKINLEFYNNKIKELRHAESLQRRQRQKE